MKRIIRLSNEILYANVGQRAAKLHVLTVCTVLDSNLGHPESNDSQNKLAKNIASDPKGPEYF